MVILKVSKNKAFMLFPAWMQLKRSSENADKLHYGFNYISLKNATE